MLTDDVTGLCDCSNTSTLEVAVRPKRDMDAEEPLDNEIEKTQSVPRATMKRQLSMKMQQTSQKRMQMKEQQPQQKRFIKKMMRLQIPKVKNDKCGTITSRRGLADVFGEFCSK